MFDWGLGNSGATLASRFLGLPNLFITNEDVGDPGQCRAWFDAPDMDTPMAKVLLGIVGIHPHFPYGFNLIPDVPL